MFKHHKISTLFVFSSDNKHGDLKEGN